MSPLQLHIITLLMFTGELRLGLGNNTSTATSTTTAHTATTKPVSPSSPTNGTCYACCRKSSNVSPVNVSVSYVYHQNCKLHALDHPELLNLTTNATYCMHDCWLNALKKIYQGFNVTINQTHYCYKPYSTREFTPAVTKWATAIVVFVKLTQFLENNE
uniref:GP4 protein n=1 Tax=Mikumi yellow baboon virus 1 TaxID=1546177 RepID=A0A089FYD6_9NIDO|nr:GP4 protein [Mikumi yellow baboon virus 1]